MLIVNWFNKFFLKKNYPYRSIYTYFGGKVLVIDFLGMFITNKDNDLFLKLINEFKYVNSTDLIFSPLKRILFLKDNEKETFYIKNDLLLNLDYFGEINYKENKISAAKNKAAINLLNKVKKVNENILNGVYLYNFSVFKDKEIRSYIKGNKNKYSTLTIYKSDFNLIFNVNEIIIIPTTFIREVN